MKKIFKVLAISLTIGITFFPIRNMHAQQVSVSFQVFYDQLSPYGTWVNYQRYGYVWIPTDVPPGFRPYATGGHWVYTEDGWTWVSDYTWGWAAFHYGNWFYDQSYGWMWLPDYEWAPAWVTWGQYEDNYCWAPIGPHINIGVAYASYRPPAYCWTFVPRTYITNVNINRYYVNRASNTTVINNITVINNVNRNVAGNHAVFMRGPQAENVERYTHSAIRPVQIRGTSTPGRGQVQNGQLALYRPAINRNSANARPAPARVEDVNRIKPSNLPATNTDAHTNNAIRNDNMHNVKPVAVPNRPVNSAPANRRPDFNAPANNNPVNHAAPRQPSYDPNRNREVLKPANDHRQMPPPAASRRVNPAPAHNNYPAMPTEHQRPSNMNRAPVQQQSTHATPPPRQPMPPPRQQQPQQGHDPRHR